LRRPDAPLRSVRSLDHLQWSGRLFALGLVPPLWILAPTRRLRRRSRSMIVERRRLRSRLGTRRRLLGRLLVFAGASR
jgi:hypothetical protein